MNTKFGPIIQINEKYKKVKQKMEMRTNDVLSC